MRYSLRCLLAVIPVVLCAGFVLSGDESIENPAKPGTNGDVFDHQRLCVTIWPAKTQVKAGEEFEVKLRVVNSSETPQSLKVWNCSWDSHWKWRNSGFQHSSWECFKNFVTTLQLEPGAAWEKTLVMHFSGEGSAKTTSLRMGFTPEGEKHTYWSNEVVLGVK